MERPPLEIITLAGTATDVGFLLGKRRAAKIERHIESWNRFLGVHFRGQRDRLRFLERSFLAEARRYAPGYVDEVAAMAEGAGVPFRDLFRLNLTELHTYAEKCTTLLFPVTMKGMKRIFLAHNEDWDPKRSDVFILKAMLPDVSYLLLAYDGYLPGVSTGINSHGLAHAINFLRPSDARPGLPRICITRKLVTARNVNECLTWMRGARRAFGQSIHLLEKGKYTGLELTARRMVVRRPPLPTVHTNHYISAPLRPVNPSPTPSSRLRLAVAHRLLRKKIAAHELPLTIAKARSIAREILSDRSAMPYAIWREADTPEDSAATLATVFMGFDDRTLEVYRHRPSQGGPLKVRGEW